MSYENADYVHREQRDGRGTHWPGEVFAHVANRLLWRHNLAPAWRSGIKGNFFDAATREEYWVSGPKKRGGDAHPAERVSVRIDEEVQEEYWVTIRR